MNIFPVFLYYYEINVKKETLNCKVQVGDNRGAARERLYMRDSRTATMYCTFCIACDISNSSDVTKSGI